MLSWRHTRSCFQNALAVRSQVVGFCSLSGVPKSPFLGGHCSPLGKQAARDMSREPDSMHPLHPHTVPSPKARGCALVLLETGT